MRAVLGDNRLLLCLTLLVAATAATMPVAAHQPSPAEGEAHEQSATRVLERYCFECHGAETQEAGLRFDRFERSFQGFSGEELDRVVNAVREGIMPPEEAESPTAREREALLAGLEVRLDRLAHDARRTAYRLPSRRLTVEEYNFTMQDLFGVEAEFADLLPADPISEAGYRNDRQRLGISTLQIESYLDAARRAVARYVPFGRLSETPVRYHVEFEDLFYSTAVRYDTRARAPQPIDLATLAARRAANAAAKPNYVDPLSPMRPGAHTDDESMRAAIPKLHQQYVAIPQRLAAGEMIVRIRAAGTPDRRGRFPRMRVEAGITLGDGCSIDKRMLGEVDVAAPLDRPQTYEFRIRLEDVPTKGPLRDGDTFDRLSVFDMDQLFIANVSCDDKAIFANGRGSYSSPVAGSQRIDKPLKQMAHDGVNFLHLDALEIEMHPGAGENTPYRWHCAESDPPLAREQETEAAAKLLRDFMQAAYRRPVTDQEAAAKLVLFHALRDDDHSFEESLRETLAAVLVSPSFLFLELNPPANNRSPGSESAPGADFDGDSDPYRLASRLSYLIWLSPPDEQLLQHAADRSLLRRDVLRGEAQRMLANPRSRRFLESFCRQWLRLDRHANVAVDRRVHASYDDDLAALSIDETLAFFVEVFQSDSSALDLLDSDYAMLNDRLASHYELEPVNSGELRRVALPSNSVRGGLLTQASLLTMNSDGADSHPIRRGVWLLERILNRPPPPPPPNVPEIDESDPQLRGLSLQERIEVHRRPGACQGCHRRIDPWGMALENFDATGRWREQVAQSGGKAASLPVDAAVVLPGGKPIAGAAELKAYLREQQAAQFAQSLTHHLVTYSLGRSPDFSDRQQLRAIQRRFMASEYRLRELVLAIIDSPMFYQSSEEQDSAGAAILSDSP